MAEAPGSFDLTKKVGPLPLWGWGLGVAALAWLVISRRAAAAAAAGGGSSTPAGGGGQFSTSTTSTDPKTGNQTTYQASGPNSSITSPAQLSYGAGPMPYSGGDVYVNYPGGAGPAGPQGPPGAGPPAVIPPRNPDWGKWETVVSGDTLAQLTARVLGDPALASQVWSDPVNKAVHDLRGDPSRLQPGDVVWVFNGWKPGWQPPADFVAYPNVATPGPDPTQN